MSNPGNPTYEQLRTFLAVVDQGSFAGAARHLNRAVSVVSYGISNLEAQLGVLLFDREGTRKPKLTDAGRAVLVEARTIGQGFDGLRAKVKGLLDGLEAEVNLAVDVMLPSARLGAVLRAFNVEFPTVSLRLHVEALGAVASLVMDRSAVLGISGPLAAGWTNWIGFLPVPSRWCRSRPRIIRSPARRFRGPEAAGITSSSF